MSRSDITLIDAPALEEALRDSPISPLPAFRDVLSRADQALKDRFFEGVDTSVLVHQRADVLDQLIRRAWHYFIDSKQTNIALVAVGGYGRRELHSGSDIDLLILLRQSDHGGYRESIEGFLTLIWDLKIDVGHSTRSVAECVNQAAGDITVVTSLMEARLLAGPLDLFEAMNKRISPDRIWPSRDFFEAKWREQIARHHKFHDAVYNLEPNVKEGPGGLRDIQMIGWVAKRHFGAKTLHDLVHHRFLTELEYHSLMDGQAFLWKVRMGLHFLAGRREDRLLFDHQKTLAQQFGYQDTEHRRAVEKFMKDYYVTITELNRLNEMLLQLFQEVILHADEPSEPIPLSNRFQTQRGFIEVTDDDVFMRYPFALLEIFLLLQQHPEFYGVRASTIRLIRDHRHLIDEKFRNDLRNRSLFMEILRQPIGITHQLRRMNRYGILAEYIPAFGRVVGLMQYDLFHAYTVDEHSLMVLRNMRRFTVPKYANENPVCGKVVGRIPKLEILYLAGLFHDIAKGRGGDHSKLGAEEALDFCLKHGLSKYDARVVSWLVRYHLVMSTTAQRQDISDPDVIANFAKIVGDQVHLNYLYLLTVADIRGTNPGLWNNWKDALLLELYLTTSRALRRGLENPIDKIEHIDEIQAQVRSLLGTSSLLDTQIESLLDTQIEQIWASFDDDYFLRHTPDEIAWHTQAIAVTGEYPLVLIRQEEARGATSIFLYTPDRDYLFAATTQALDELGLDILDARIITTTRGFVLDTFLVLDAQGNPIKDLYQIESVTKKLKNAVSHSSRREILNQRRMPRRLKHFEIPTEITFSTDLANQRTVMELISGDRPGFLAIVGKILVECNVSIKNAKIGTFGERVEDVFFLTDKNNQPLHSHECFACIKRNLRNALDGERV